jgi:hypothetical protein
MLCPCSVASPLSGQGAASRLSLWWWLPSLQVHDGLLANSSCVSPVKSLLWFVPEPTMTTLFGVVQPCWRRGPRDAPPVGCPLWCGSKRKLCDGGACGRHFSLLKARKGTSCCLSRGGSMLVAGFKRLAELGRRGWLCGAQRHSMVCLGTVKPSSTPVARRRRGVVSLGAAFSTTPPMQVVSWRCVV